jgi:hypothetical protein
MTTPHDTPLPSNETRKRHRILIGAASAVLLLLITVSVVLLWPDSGEHDQPPRDTSPSAIAAAFLQRYAAGTGSACELAADELRASLTKNGRCEGTGETELSTVETVFVTTCGDRTGVGAKVSKPGKLGSPYARVSLIRSGDTWRVRALLPISDGSTLSSYPCAAPPTEYGG